MGLVEGRRYSPAVRPHGSHECTYISPRSQSVNLILFILQSVTWYCIVSLLSSFLSRFPFSISYSTSSRRSGCRSTSSLSINPLALALKDKLRTRQNAQVHKRFRQYVPLSLSPLELALTILSQGDHTDPPVPPCHPYSRLLWYVDLQLNHSRLEC